MTRTTGTVPISMLRVVDGMPSAKKGPAAARYNVSPYLVRDLYYEDLKKHEGIRNTWRDLSESARIEVNQTLNQTLNNAQNICFGYDRIVYLTEFFKTNAILYSLYGNRSLPPEERVQDFVRHYKDWKDLTIFEILDMHKAMAFWEESFYATWKALPRMFAERFDTYRNAYRFAIKVLERVIFEDIYNAHERLRITQQGDTKPLQLGATEAIFDRLGTSAQTEPPSAPGQVERPSISSVHSSTQIAPPNPTPNDPGQHPSDRPIWQRRPSIQVPRPRIRRKFN